ncbi:MAG: hypothetical protein IT305_02290 [Chloroflexi bacterium]|nr:hypothetical protein [Chloroflexota bacterium]
MLISREHETEAAPPTFPFSALSLDRTIAAEVLDADGAALCDVAIRGSSSADVVELVDVDAPDRLLTYYFGRGERRVMLECRGCTTEGRLETHWIGSARSWWIELETR